MEESKEIKIDSGTKSGAAFDGSVFRAIYQEGVDLTASSEVTDLAREIVYSNISRDYLFVCNSATTSSSTYTLYICTGLIYTDGVFFGQDVQQYTFSVTASISVSWSTPTSNIDFTYDNKSGVIRDRACYIRPSVSISPSVSQTSSFSFSTTNNSFYYSSITDFHLTSFESKGVSILAAIAFILAVLGCSLWFAAIFRNVQRR